MKRKLHCFLLVLFTTLLFAQPRLLTIDSSRALYQLDMATGARTSLGMVGAAAGTAAGLAYDRFNNILYLTSSGNDALYTLDRNTLAVTLIGSYGNPDIVMHGLEYHEPTGKLYGMSSHNAGLYEINKNTGAATLVGVTGLSSFCNLGWDSTNNIMYMTSSGNDSFYSINLLTGAATLIGALNGPTNPHGMAYDHIQNRLFLIDSSTDILYTINRATGTANAIGSVGSGNYLGLVYINETLSVPGFGADSVVLYQQNQQLIVDSQQSEIISIAIYDITGRKLYGSNTVNSNHFETDIAAFANQLLIVKAHTVAGTVTKKITNK